MLLVLSCFFHCILAFTVILHKEGNSLIKMVNAYLRKEDLKILSKNIRINLIAFILPIVVA